MSTVLSENVLFRLESEGEKKFFLRFLSEKRYFPFQALRALLTLREHVSDGEVTLTGIASVEAYAAAGYYLTLCGAHRIMYLGGDTKYPAFLLGGEKVACLGGGERHFTNSPREGYDLVTFVNSPEGGMWPMEDFLSLSPVSLEHHSRPLQVTGMGHVYQYAAMGVRAGIEGREELRISKPICLETFCFTPSDMFLRLPEAGRDVEGKAIGVLGDPNSGKSVFSNSLANALKLLFPNEFSSWCWDADLAAPTPLWYLASQASQDDGELQEKNTQQRMQMKQQWGTELEREAAKTIQNLKRNLNLTIVDFPGGKHPKPVDGKPASPPERIPSTARANMLNLCDGFIILSRQDKPESFQAWRRELEKHGIHKPILAHFISGAYDSPFQVTSLPSQDGMFMGRIDGLRRENKISNNGKILKEKIVSLAEALRTFATR